MDRDPILFIVGAVAGALFLGILGGIAAVSTGPMVYSSSTPSAMSSDLLKAAVIYKLAFD